ncbi:unnamed protein product [Ectocarpus sp. 4 AP-2014]
MIPSWPHFSNLPANILRWHWYCRHHEDPSLLAKARKAVASSCPASPSTVAFTGSVWTVSSADALAKASFGNLRRLATPSRRY